MTGGMAGLWPGFSEGLAEWIVTATGGEQMMLQMAYFDRCRARSPWTSAPYWTWRT